MLLVRNMLKNNVPAPSCIPPAGLEVLIRQSFQNMPRENCTRAAGWSCSQSARKLTASRLTTLTSFRSRALPLVAAVAL
jgi:hypothetical protein